MADDYELQWYDYLARALPVMGPILVAQDQAKAEKEVNALAQEVAERNAQIAEYNAETARIQMRTEAALLDVTAASTEKLGRVAAGRLGSEATKLNSTQKVRQAASGVDIDSGSAVDVREGTAMMAALDMATIQNNAIREAWGLKQQAESQRFAASRLKSDAESIRAQAKLDALASKHRERATFVTGAARAGGQVLELGMAGISKL